MKGEVVYLFAFDVANEIARTRVQEILSEKPFPFEIPRDRTMPKDVALYRPMAIEPPPLDAALFGAPVRVLIRVYDFGVVTVMMRTKFQAGQLDELMHFHNPILEDGVTLDRAATALCTRVCDSLKNAIVGPNQFSPAPEAYTVFCLTDLEEAVTTDEWIGKRPRDVAGLLTETAAADLSDSQVAEVLRIQRSFEKTDLAVIDWDAALVVDLKGYVDDVLYALELANLQLEEFRVMDQRLDQYLDHAYEDLERRGSTLFGVANKTLRHLRRFRVDVAMLTDEVTHITKFFGDWHLARIYLGARERFYLDEWRQSVEQRLAQLDKLYSVVHSEVNEKRILWLEIVMVIFFALDLGIMLWFGR